ncbi:MAG: hypothetical protein IPP77_15095 [Bacteroidetes bacterium]|nr:hypothetical protein [Bacteroidota bacterium]
MTWTGVTHTPTLAGASSNPISIYGSLTLTAAMNMTYAGVVNFEAASTGKTITTGGKSFANAINFNGVGGGWTLQDIFATPNGTITLNGGALNSNGQTVNCSSFASTVATPRGLVMGSSVFNVSYISFTSWQVYAPGLTLNAGTSTINLTGNNPSFSPGIGFGGGGGLTYYDLNFPGPCKSGLIQSAMNFHNVSFATDGVISASCTFNNLTFSPNHNYTLTNGTTQTINGSLSATGTCTGPITIKSSTGGSQATINSPNPVSVSYVSIKDIKATGAAFTASNSNDQGNNTGWTFGGGGGQNLYWIGGTGNWNDGNHWSLTSGGAIFGCSPGAADNVFFDLNSFNATSQIVTINVTAACNDMTWTGVTNTPTLAGVSSNPIRIYGSLTLTAAMNMTYAGVVNFEAASTGKTITTGGKSFANAINFNGIGGGWILQDVFSTPNGTITLNGGTLNSNGQTVNCSSFTSTVATPRGLIMGSSVFNVSYISFTSWPIGICTGIDVECGYLHH